MKLISSRHAANGPGRTGTFGLIFQLITVTIVSPIYLALEVFQGETNSSFNELTIDPRDLDAIPWGTTVSFVIPTLGMIVPLLNIASAELNYLLIALWQPFPLYQSALHPILRNLYPSRSHSGVSVNAYERSMGKAYGFILKLCAGTHLIVLAAALLSQSHDSMPAISLSKILVPESLGNSPTLATLSPPVSALESRAVVTNFLKWDIYCACTAFSIWAGYHTYNSDKGANLLTIAFRIAFWAVVGGPIAPAAVLLWDRDVAALEEAKRGERSRKKN